MTLSWPSFLAAASSDSMPPRSFTLVAVAALADEDSLFFSGGEQAVIAAMVVAAKVTATERARIRTVFLLLRHRTGARWVDHGSAWWRPGVRRASGGRHSVAGRAAYVTGRGNRDRNGPPYRNPYVRSRAFRRRWELCRTGGAPAVRRSGDAQRNGQPARISSTVAGRGGRAAAAGVRSKRGAGAGCGTPATSTKVARARLCGCAGASAG